MNVAIGTVLTVALVAALGWWLGTIIAVWNTRPMSMYDTKLERWRAHSLLGTPWRTKRHGTVARKPLERRSHVTTLEHPVLDPLLDRPA
jgi:hypothetical protein